MSRAFDKPALKYIYERRVASRVGNSTNLCDNEIQGNFIHLCNIERAIWYIQVNRLY